MDLSLVKNGCIILSTYNKYAGAFAQGLHFPFPSADGLG